MVFSDSHCHLDLYPPERLAEILAEAKAKGVDIIISMGMNIDSSTETVRLAQSNEGVQAGIGIHPWNAVPPTDDVTNRLNELARQPSVVVIGEIGLDYIRSPETKEIQKELLRYELTLARETNQPVNIHCREAHGDMMEILHELGGSELKGIIHGFTGDPAEMKDWLDLGFYISIGRRITMANDTSSLHAAARELPIDHLLTETDAAGQVAGPAEVVDVVRALASLRQTREEEITDTATVNLKSILKL